MAKRDNLPAPCSQSELKEILSCDDMGRLWWLPKSGRNMSATKPAGTIQRSGHRRVTIRKKRYMAHRLVWLWHKGEWPASDLDHIDLVEDNNAIDNLRLSSRSQNSANGPVRSHNKLGVKGVYMQDGKYRAGVTKDGKQHYVGFFDTLEEAKAAWDKKAKELHEDFFHE